jgi:hypothetical protein
MTHPNPASRATPQRGALPQAAPPFAGTPRASGPAPAPAASLRRRLDGRRAGAPRPGRGAVVATATAAVEVSAGVDLLVVTAGGSPTTAALVMGAGIVGGLTGGVGWLFRTRWGLDAPSRELRRRISAETRTAAAVEPLESAGWVALHDRLVAHERVPHILLGPPGALVLHPHSFGRLASTLARLRRVARLGRRPAPRPVLPDELGDPTALRTRDNLVTVTAGEPDLDGWYHLARAVVPILDRPADAGLPEPTPVVHLPAGTVLRRALETELPAGISRTAVAYLASIVDHACPPA